MTQRYAGAGQLCSAGPATMRGPCPLRTPTFAPLQVADQLGVSSLHINFLTRDEYDLLGGSHGYLQRLGLQYHWYACWQDGVLAVGPGWLGALIKRTNAAPAAPAPTRPLCRYNTRDVTQSLLASVGSSIDDEAAGAGSGPAGDSKYASFDGEDASFLMALKQSKRKSIRQVGAGPGFSAPCCRVAGELSSPPPPPRAPTHGPPQERKKAAQEGLRFLRLTGDQIQARHWAAFHKFYLNTTGAGGRGRPGLHAGARHCVEARRHLAIAPRPCLRPQTARWARPT